ncbi:hypothetical protein DY000_02059614 [Brassica cretica]|uniref:Retrotransposon gag domain-containing protein n=1 Tax=Brassica cretica TaxID=69181 RepID=A0ABQ7AN35_BRACR|nr:hypothetical protein DY000_02059614 [Brassica cretica]
MATECVAIPVFTGASMRSWISWLEKFFVREDFTDDDDKLNFAQSFMEGEAILWFQWRQSLWLFNSWEALKKSLWLRFGSDEDPENIIYNTEIQKGLEQLRRNLLIFIIRVFRTVQYSEAAKLDLVYGSLEGAGRDWYNEEGIKEHVESTSNEALQAASETCSNALPEPYYSLVLEALPYEICSDGLCVQDGGEPYILQVQTDDESKPPSIDSESIHYVPKLVNKEFLRDKTRKHTRKQRLSPKSWQFKYKKRIKLSINSELLGLSMVNEMRVGWLQKRQKLLLSKHKLRMDDILGEKINGMGYVANDVSESDVLVRITGNSENENENADVSLRQTENEPTTLKLLSVHQLCDQNSERVTSKKKNKRYPKTWNFKYKDEETDFQNVEMTKGMVSATYEILDALSSIVRSDGAVVDNWRYVSRRKKWSQSSIGSQRILSSGRQSLARRSGHTVQ